jgi:hypothetical protein
MFRKLLAVLAVAILVIGMALPVFAISTSPTVITLNSVNVYENCLELGDMLFWADWTVTYAVTPTEPITNTYILRLVNTGGADIRDALPYSYFQRGYSEGLTSIYFTAAEVTSFGLTWSSSTYYMRVDGNPSANWTGGGSIPVSNQIGSGAFTWKSSTTVGQNQAIIASDILSEAQMLQDTWNNANYILITAAASTGLRLYTQGEAYFTNVLPNMSALAPSVLIAPNVPLQFVTKPVVASPATGTIASDMQGSTLDLTGAANALHIGGMWLGIILTLGITLFVAVHGTKEVNSYKPLILLTLPMLYVFTRIGWFPMPLTIGLGLFAAFTIWYVLFFEKTVS